MNIHEQIKREIGAHGDQWDSMHDGYFSDKAVARPFVTTIAKYLSNSDSDVIVDLGGGTGFILRELAAEGAITNMTPVNMDCSAAQLDLADTSGICCVNSLISEFNRKDLSPFGRRIFFIMRSVLHYFGQDGLILILQHIRDQARKGEMFIHQTACFQNAADAQCMNALYCKMGTPKWYPLVDELRHMMINANWEVMDIIPASPLTLSSSELGQRYGLDGQTLEKIRHTLLDEFGEIKNVFQPTPDGFTAYLHYNICVARAS